MSYFWLNLQLFVDLKIIGWKNFWDVWYTYNELYFYVFALVKHLGLARNFEFAQLSPRHTLLGWLPPEPNVEGHLTYNVQYGETEVIEDIPGKQPHEEYHVSNEYSCWRGAEKWH